MEAIQNINAASLLDTLDRCWKTFSTRRSPASRPPPGGSRFRRRTDPGVFCRAEERKTACAECGYRRLRFWLDSAGLSARYATVELTPFEFAAADNAIDLSRPPLSSDRGTRIRNQKFGRTPATPTDSGGMKHSG
jgi:hypothetical protein